MHREAKDEESRIEALEIRAAHQDRMIDDLNDVIAQQWREIERLKRRMAALDDQIEKFEQFAQSGQKEPPPPHY